MQERAGRFFKADEEGELVSEFSKLGKELEKLGFPVGLYYVLAVKPSFW